jgi:hypothetical protein
MINKEMVLLQILHNCCKVGLPFNLTEYTALKDNPENLSVLLHLDMENLGSLNVHIRMSMDKLETVFYPEDKTAGRLITDNLPSLVNTLKEKGYSITAEVKDTYKKPDFCRDFIEQDSPDGMIRQYTFDIRT